MCRPRCLILAALFFVSGDFCCQGGLVKIYWAWNDGGSKGGVERVDPDGTNRTLLTSKTNYPAGVSLDPSTGKIYYSLAGGWDIRNCDLDGGDNQMVIEDGGYYFRDIDLDVVGGKMYWAAGHPGTNGVKQILRANLDGTGMEYLYAPADDTNETNNVSLDLTNGNIYWSDFGSRGSPTDGAISYGILDGSAPATITHVGGDPRGVTVDPAGGKVYWSDYADGGATTGKIYSANLDLTGITPIITGLTGPNALALDVAAGKIYWSDLSSGGSIHRSDMAGGGTTETLVTSIGNRASDMTLLFDNIPAPWTAEDVGSPTMAGYAVHHAPTGRFVVDSASTDIWNNNDEFQYVHQSHDNGSKDFTAMVRLWSQEDTQAWAKAGLMARDGTDPAAPFAMTVGTPAQGIRFQWREDGSTEDTNQLTGSPNTAKDGAAPVWLILRRRGDTFHSYYAEDANGQPGVWSSEATKTLALPANLELGMAVSSHDASAYGTGIFDNVKLGDWEPRARLVVGSEGRFAGAAYAVDDSNGDGTFTGDEVVDVHWKIERVEPAAGLASHWFLDRHSADWSGTPDYQIVASNVDRATWVYPQEIMDGEGLNPGDNMDDFAVKYSGEVYADHTGTFAFQESVDDYARLYIDEQLIITDNSWNYDRSATVALTEGWHKIEFYTWDGSAGDKAHLNWDPTGGTNWSAVPEQALRFSLLGEGTSTVGGLTSQGFFNDIHLLGPNGWYRLTAEYLGEQVVSLYDVPEPSASLLLLIGLGLLFIRKRRGQA